MLDCPINQWGVYAFKRADHGLENWMYKNQDCTFDDAMRQKWRKMIINASFGNKLSNRTLGKEELFERTNNPNVVIVAINIQREDFVDWGRRLVPDQT